MIREAELTYIKKRVHELYRNEDLNCARALLALIKKLTSKLTMELVEPTAARELSPA